MAATFRLIYSNALFASAAAAPTASSFASTLPPSFLLDQLLSKVWRSGGPYVVVANFNDRLDFNDGSDRAAVLTAGTYTGTALATHIQTQMNAVSSGYTVGYGTVSSNKFTISRATNFTLKWSTGTNVLRSIGKCLGFVVTSDDSGTNTYTSDTVTFQSRHYVFVDSPSFMSDGGPAAVLALGHNLSTNGQLRLQGGSDSTFQTGISTDEVLASGGTGTGVRWDYFTSTPVRYWRLVVEDVQNTEAFAELGVWTFGPYVDMAYQPTFTDWVEQRDELSGMAQAIDGAIHGDIRPSRIEWSLRWSDLSDTELAKLNTLQDAMPPPRCFFVDFDATDANDVPQYLYFQGGLAINRSTPTLWDVVATLVEALG